MSDETPEPTRKSTRRTVLNLAVLGGTAGLVYGGVGILQRLTEPALAFEPIAGVPGFRWVEGGPISGGSTIMVGIGSGDAAPDPTPSIGTQVLCRALFGPAPDPNRVQIAYFTDYRCFYCRTVSPMLADMERDGTVQVTWHDLPLLGQISTIAAQAAVAAREQGAYHAFHARLMGTPAIPTPPYLREISADAGIDGTRLLRDMRSPTTQKQLQTTAAIAHRFGFIGTPALVVGRTAILGAVDRRMIDRLVDAERRETSPGAC